MPTSGHPRRRRIFRDRQPVIVRMDEQLNARMMAFCEVLELSANHYVSALLRGLIAERVPISRLKTASDRSTDRVTVTFRFLPEMHQQVKAYSDELGMSMNRLVCHAIAYDLSRRGH